MLALLDTSVLIGRDAVPPQFDVAISVVSIAELHFGLLRADDDEVRGLRAVRLGMLEARFPAPIPIDARVAREWGRLQAAVAQRGGRPRNRIADLAIAATANVHDAVLMTRNMRDLDIIGDMVRAQAPS